MAGALLLSGFAAGSFLLGAYAGNPNGSDRGAEAAFERQLGSFEARLGGARPQVMNGFVDFTQSPSAWPSNAGWTAWSWTQSPMVRTSMIPVMGVPMSDNAHWAGNPPGSTNDDFFKQIVAGAYDADYAGVVDAWADAGFTSMYLRLGYEMNGSFMPWFMGDDPQTQADWVAAFQHLATLMRAEASADGAVAHIVWNPTDINYSAQPVQNAYPGDSYVDVVATDAYSPLYPNGLYDWQLNNGTYDATIQEWWASRLNRRHFWTYPSATQWNPEGTTGSGWSLDETIALALAHHKPLAVSESGAGGNGSSNGPVDDPAFPHWLARELTTALAAGVQPAYVDIWDDWLSDGDWDFSSPRAGKPQEADAWAADFGAVSGLASQSNGLAAAVGR